MNLTDTKTSEEIVFACDLYIPPPHHCNAITSMPTQTRKGSMKKQIPGQPLYNVTEYIIIFLL